MSCVKGGRAVACPENLHRPGLTTPCGLRRAKVGFRTRHRQYIKAGAIRYIIVVKLIKSVIANPADRKEGLRPLSLPYNEKIISIYDDRIVKRTGFENDFGPYLSQAYNEK